MGRQFHPEVNERNDKNKLIKKFQGWKKLLHTNEDLKLTLLKRARHQLVQALWIHPIDEELKPITTFPIPRTRVMLPMRINNNQEPAEVYTMTEA